MVIACYMKVLNLSLSIYLPIIYLFICSLFFKINLFILFLAALGLRSCTWAFSVVVHRLLIAAASRCGARALGAQASVVVARGLSSRGAQA